MQFKTITPDKNKQTNKHTHTTTTTTPPSNYIGRNLIQTSKSTQKIDSLLFKANGIYSVMYPGLLNLCAADSLAG